MAQVHHVASVSVFARPFHGLTAKVLVALVALFTVRLLLGQAPTPGTPREEVDDRGYKYQPPLEAYLKKDNITKLQEQKASVMKVVKAQPSQINEGANRPMLDRYYLQYYFPMMTTPDGLKIVGSETERVKFQRDHLQAARDPTTHGYLLGITLPTMMRIVQENYHPAARYNAMLIVSNLNDVEPNNLGSNPTLPEPMARALPFILQQFQKEDNPDAIKLAALLGLSRHLEWENYKTGSSTPLPADRRTQIVDALTTVAEQKEPPAGRDAESHTWFRRRAVEAVSMGSLTKPDARIIETLNKLLNDETDSLAVRTTVASCLGRISLQPPAKIDPLATAKGLGFLALVACDAELTRAESKRKAEIEHEARLTGTFSGESGYGGEGSGMPGGGIRPMPGMSSPGMGEGGGLRPVRPAPGVGSTTGDGYGGINGIDPGMMDPKHYRMEYLRRRIRQELFAVQLGLTGGEDRAKATTGSPTPPSGQGQQPEKKGVYAIAKEKKPVEDIYLAVRKLIEVVENASEVDLAAFDKDLRAQMKFVEAAIGRRLPPPGAANPAAVADDAPAAPGKAAAGKGKAIPAKAGARPVAPGKTTSTAPRRPMSVRPAAPVFAQPRTGR